MIHYFTLFVTIQRRFSMGKIETSRLEYLRDITNNALRCQMEEQQRKTVAEELLWPVHERKAQKVIDQIDGRTEREARLGRRHAVIMSLREKTDFERPLEGLYHFGECRPEWLMGASKLVYTFLIEEGGAPTIEWWSTQDDGGFNIIAHW